MMHASARSSRVLSLSRLATVVMLVSMSVGSFPGIASAAAPGSQLWAMNYDGASSGKENAKVVAVSPDGSKVFVTGRSAGNGTDLDYATVAYDASTGAKIWAARYDGPASGSDQASSVALSPGGTEVYVTGLSRGNGTDFDYATVAYAASTGKRLWVARYDGPAGGRDRAYSVASTPTAVFVTGWSRGNGTGVDYATIAYTASTGDGLWTQRYDGRGGNDFADSLAVSPDSTKVFVTGQSQGRTADYATVSYAATTGRERWASRYDGTANGVDSAYSVAVSPDGSAVFVTGGSNGVGTDFDYGTLAYASSSGAKLWAKRYNGPAASFDFAVSLAVSPDGTKVFVTGNSYGAGGSSDYATVGYSASTGGKLWVGTYDGTAHAHDFAGSLAVSPDGAKVFVTGESWGYDSGVDYATIAYATSTGVDSWITRYNGHINGNDAAHSVAVSPDSTMVFVTGVSEGPTGTDYGTVAYAA